jgi:hypothetical protein
MMAGIKHPPCLTIWSNNNNFDSVMVSGRNNTATATNILSNNISFEKQT